MCPDPYEFSYLIYTLIELHEKYTEVTSDIDTTKSSPLSSQSMIIEKWVIWICCEKSKSLFCFFLYFFITLQEWFIESFGSADEFISREHRDEIWEKEHHGTLRWSHDFSYSAEAFMMSLLLYWLWLWDEAVRDMSIIPPIGKSYSREWIRV